MSDAEIEKAVIALVDTERTQWEYPKSKQITIKK